MTDHTVHSRPFNDQSSTPGPRFAQRQPTQHVELKPTEYAPPPPTDMARVAGELKRIGDLLERLILGSAA